jgi:hypothetical protein
MKIPVSLMCLALTVGSAAAASAPQARITIKPIGDCIRLDQINEWHVVNARTVIVRTGPKRYRADLQNDCPRLALGPPGLFFHPNASNQAISDGRICGEVGETVSSPHQPPCAIQSLKIIDKAAFDRLASEARRHGSGADQPSATP